MPLQTSAAASRMEPIATLPVFFKLAGRRVVLAGDGAPAVWKAELLAAAGAAVQVFAETPDAALLALQAAPPGSGTITLVRRHWRPADLAGASLAVGAIEDAAGAGAFRDAAHAAGVPVNVIDNPPFCDFQFGTVVSRSPLVIGISTDGAAPVFGQALRARIEALLPQGLKAWAQAAKDWRPAVQAMGLDFRGRRRFWEAFTDRALAADDRSPDATDLEACRAALAGGTAAAAELVLCGAGPGDPDLITLAAVRALQSADIVAHPEDLPPALARLARREAERVTLAPDGDHAEVIASHLARGQRLVWLDRGHPEICQVWQARAESLGAHATLYRVAGLGRCTRCMPVCPAWGGAAG